MANEKQLIDSFFEKGSYDESLKMEKQWIAEAKQFEKFQKLLGSDFEAMQFHVGSDLAILGAAAKDYKQAMNQIVIGRPPSKAKFIKMHDLYSLALVIVQTDNDMLEAFFITGLAGAFVIFPFAMLALAAQRVAAILPGLIKTLKEAESRCTKLKWKRFLHVVITALEALFPEISIAARAGIIIADIAMDEFCKPKEESQTVVAKNAAITTVKQFTEQVEHIHSLHWTLKAGAQEIGLGASAVTLYIDTKEIEESEEKAEALAELTESFKNAYEDLVKLIDKHKPKLVQFEAVFNRWMQGVRDLSDTAQNGRDEFNKQYSDLHQTAKAH
jgi:hypothetical protein